MKDFKKMAKDVVTKVGDLISPPEKFDPTHHNKTNSIMKKTKKSLYMPEAKYNILKGFASNRNISMNSLIIEALDKMYGLELFADQKFTIQKDKETNKNK